LFEQILSEFDRVIVLVNDLLLQIFLLNLLVLKVLLGILVHLE